MLPLCSHSKGSPSYSQAKSVHAQQLQTQENPETLQSQALQSKHSFSSDNSLQRGWKSNILLSKFHKPEPNFWHCICCNPILLECNNHLAVLWSLSESCFTCYTSYSSYYSLMILIQVCRCPVLRVPNGFFQEDEININIIISRVESLRYRCLPVEI